MKKRYYIEVYVDGNMRGEVVYRKDGFVKLKKFMSEETAERFADKLRKKVGERCTLEVKVLSDELKKAYKKIEVEVFTTSQEKYDSEGG